MKKIILGIVICLSQFASFAGNEAQGLISQVNKKFSSVADYTAQVNMKFDVPGVKMNQMRGKVFFKKPNKFRIKAKGIFFLPKQNPIQNIAALLLDTTSYTSVISGYEVMDGKQCAIVNIIPLKSDGELILGKFWIDKSEVLVLKSQITTKGNGTIETRNIYGVKRKYALPDQIVLNFEMKKIKMPKMMSVDLNKKSKAKSDEDKKESGSITLNFSDYQVNSKFSDEVFTETE